MYVTCYLVNKLTLSLWSSSPARWINAHQYRRVSLNSRKLAPHFYGTWAGAAACAYLALKVVVSHGQTFDPPWTSATGHLPHPFPENYHRRHLFRLGFAAICFGLWLLLEFWTRARPEAADVRNGSFPGRGRKVSGGSVTSLECNG